MSKLIWIYCKREKQSRKFTNERVVVSSELLISICMISANANAFELNLRNGTIRNQLFGEIEINWSGILEPTSVTNFLHFLTLIPFYVFEMCGIVILDG